jgi:hypothetical protein
VEAGGVRALHAEAEDPGGSALRFTWTASDGALGTPRDTATTSDVTWTAPACGAPESPVAITVTVTNAENLSATASFSAVGLPACPSWAPTGSLTTARHGHTATLLPSGQVLVVGNARSGAVTSPAELYDPETGLWSAAPGEATTRSFPTATLLPSGRVLVAGGFQHDSSQNLATAELYTP